MKIWKNMVFCALGILFMGTLFSMAVMAGGPPLKDNACATCHDDLGTIVPKVHPSVGNFESCMSCHASGPVNKEATNFSTEVHKVHKNGKAKLECSACHAL